MKKSFLKWVCAALMLAAAPFANAAIIKLQAILSGANERPIPVATAGTGIGLFTLDTVAQTLALQITFSGLTSGTNAAHIHCCLPTPFADANAGVATLLPAFPNFPLGVTSGTDIAILDLSSAASYNPAFVANNGASVPQAEAAFIAGLISGRTYLNIHTVNFGGGEIRGFVTVVPEPGTVALVGLGIVSAAFSLRRRPKRRAAPV